MYDSHYHSRTGPNLRLSPLGGGFSSGNTSVQGADCGLASFFLRKPFALVQLGPLPQLPTPQTAASRGAARRSMAPATALAMSSWEFGAWSMLSRPARDTRRS